MKWFILFVSLLCLPFFAHAQSKAEQKSDGTTADVMKGFNANQDELSEIVAISDKRKHQVMFFMGVPLLLFILITGGLGVAMGVYGKPVFVPHMIFAGLSMTLALAHAVVGVVWFYPF